MDEFIPGNTDPERRGRVAYERMVADLGGRMNKGLEWAALDEAAQASWCHAAEAAFEEGRAFERGLHPAHEHVPRTFRGIYGEHVKCTECGELL